MIASYNGSKFILEQINSLLNQTLIPNEIIICDDNSTDDTVGIARRIAEQANIPILVSTNRLQLGYRANFMQAASLASSDLISFCDQDDIWHPEKLQVIADSFTSNNILLVFHNAELADESGRRVGRFVYNSNLPSRVFGRLEMSPWNSSLGFTQTFRRELLQLSTLRVMTEDPFIQSENLAHDQWMPLLAGAFGKIIYLDKVLVDHRQHQNNLFGITASDKPTISNFAEKVLRNIDYGRLSRVSLKISQMFKSAKLHLPPEIASKADDAQYRYSELAQCYNNRNNIYASQSFLARAREWKKMNKSGAYSNHHSVRFVQKAFARDFFIGVLFGGLEDTWLCDLYRTNYDGSLLFKPLD